MNWYLEVLRKYAVFDGRARRKEYWYFTLINGIILAPSAITKAVADTDLSIISMISLIYSLAVLVPSLAVGVRRLHDSGRSGWWLLINFVPFVGSIIFIVFMCLPSDPGTNVYGPSPIPVTEETQNRLNP